MGERPANTTLHRKDETKGYSKDNCVWADSMTQGREGKTSLKLSVSKVQEIRNQYRLGNISQTRLAEIYGVHQTTISSVITGARWQEAA